MFAVSSAEDRGVRLRVQRRRPLLSLRPPGPEADPRETLRWMRRFEVVGGVLCLALAVVLWDEGWVRWVLIAMGVSSLSPWPGARAILRRAERDPDVLVWDPEVRRRRARWYALIAVPVVTIAGAVAGYMSDGWSAAGFVGALAGASAGWGTWSVLRSDKRS